MKNVILSTSTLKQLEDWKNTSPDILKRIVTLIIDIASHPFTGIGKPEPLKHQLKGKWSRRITDEHRLVYEVKDENIIIVSCKYHYD